jgi:ribonuclease H-related protein
MKAKNKFYSYRLADGDSGICQSWIECEKIVKGREARYRSFDTKKEAEEWLAAGAEYEARPKREKTKLKPGIYFDAGTGRGEGVEISVTDSKGGDLLRDVLAKRLINKHGKHLIKDKKATNNYGELLAAKYALQLAIKNGVKSIFGDSRLVLDFWSKGIANHKTLPQKTLKLADEVSKLRKGFERLGGRMEYVPGGDNPADLGFHK